MKITQRPHSNDGANEKTVSEGCNRYWDRIRFWKGSSNFAIQSTLLFRCVGEPETTISTGTQYRFSVELELPELLAGLASVDPESLETAVGEMLELAARPFPADEPLEDEDSDKKMGRVSARDLSETICALVKGLERSQSGNEH
ncbi:hypothetical protein [Rhodopirellula bahusiensis]|uniref:Uncharacterized protein n=1 Tax=Rhodopirellula bahusiensis TaxID=2014065 RepID=A0A2G1WCG4_9BACT|nr:hypothetical protein [Rhodopirellula bahusiensis]PHQ36691.1 hypothetical protein CEE69_04910 [Rhodopirellula bahusiensis]